MGLRRRLGAAVVVAAVISGLAVLPATALESTRVLASGTADVAGTAGARWRKVTFKAAATGAAKLTLTWTNSAAAMQFSVFDTATATRLASATGTGTTKSAKVNLTKDAAYYATVWVTTGSTPFSLSLTETLPDPPPGTNKPNIIVINTDDQRADSLKSLPKIRKYLMDAGTTYSNAYVSTPSCCPSRATLMSGQYVHNNRQYQQTNRGLNLDTTIQRYLHDGGYFTGHAGKFVHWLPITSRAPHWDRWTYFKGGYTNAQMNFDGVVSTPPGYSTITMFDKAIEYVNDFKSRDDARPFYLQLTPIAPHSPSIAEAKYAAAAVTPIVRTPAFLEADRSDKPPFVQVRSTTATAVETLNTNMTRTLYTLDDQVERLVQHLQATGELDNTMIILTSDNGYHFGEHKLISKFLPYSNAVKVPFVVRWPGHVPAGAVNTSFVTHPDIAPTILAAAGVTQNAVTFDGHDILGSDAPRPTALREYYYDPADDTRIPTWSSIQTSTYVYTEYYGLDVNDNVNVTFREYYDMVNDPHQLVNVLSDGNAANDPADLALAAQKLARMKNCVGYADCLD